MKVLVAGSDIMKINEIAITTFLNGLYRQYQDDLFVIYKGSGYVSSIVEQWINDTWAGSSSRNCFNVDWIINKWSDDPDNVGLTVLEDSKPDLIFLFGYDDCNFHNYGSFLNIPIFYMEKL